VPFDNLFADRQPDPRASILLPVVKPLKDDEDALGVLRRDANAVVPYGKDPPTAITAGRDMHAGRLVTPEFDRVSDQVLEQLTQLGGISHYGRKGIMGHMGPVLFNDYLQIVD